MYTSQGGLAVRSGGCRQAGGFTKEPTQSWSAPDLTSRSNQADLAIGRLQLQPAMRPGAVVMIGILGQHSLKVPPAEDDQPVETLTADAPHQAFGITVRDRHLDGRANDSHT